MKSKGTKLKPVTSLSQLRRLAMTDPAYKELLFSAARNLGGEETDDVDAAYRWLETNAMETDEDGVVDEVNNCIALTESFMRRKA